MIVVTGASSGIGLVTARMAARAGAAVFLISRNADALRRVCQEITAQGGRRLGPLRLVGGIALALALTLAISSRGRRGQYSN